MQGRAGTVKRVGLKRVGRPAAGPRGEKRSEMRHQVTARIADEDFALLRALAAALNTSQADIVVRGMAALLQTLPSDVRRVVAVLQRQQQSRQQK